MADTEALETQLAGLDASQSRSLLIGLAAEDPDVAARLDEHVLAFQSRPVPVRQRRDGAGGGRGVPVSRGSVD